MKQLLAFVFLFTLSWCTYASEVAGIITDRSGRGAQGAAITVTCGEFKKTVFTALSGDYHIPDVPDESACSLVIKFRGVASEPHEFNTTSGRVTFSRRVHPFEGHLNFM